LKLNDYSLRISNERFKNITNSDMEHSMQAVSYDTAKLSTLIDDLNTLVSDEQRVALIKEVIIDSSEFEKYHYFGECSYGRNLIYSNQDFEVILMCWRSGQQSVAHDHSDSLCVMKCVSGVLEEQRYIKQAVIDRTSPKADEILPTSLNTLALNQAISITDSEGLHSLKNNSAQDACTLHFYFPPIHQANKYDTNSGEATVVNSKFTSEYGIKLVL
jgi:cysteine dioxygenase